MTTYSIFLLWILIFVRLCFVIVMWINNYYASLETPDVKCKFENISFNYDVASNPLDM